jgi:ribosomal protein S12 methylthiotransferase accessory factor
MEMQVVLGEGLKVEARMDGLAVPTDQPVSEGGEGTAPAPFDLVLAGLATCTAFYARGFCLAREIDPAGMGLTLRTTSGTGGRVLDRIELDLTLPPGFPAKYEKAILRVAGSCAVKKLLDNPPAIALTAARSD